MDDKALALEATAGRAAGRGGGRGFDRSTRSHSSSALESACRTRSGGLGLRAQQLYTATSSACRPRGARCPGHSEAGPATLAANRHRGPHEARARECGRDGARAQGGSAQQWRRTGVGRAGGPWRGGSGGTRRKSAARLQETCPVSTEGGTRRVQLVREGRVGGACPRAPRLPWTHPAHGSCRTLRR